MKPEAPKKKEWPKYAFGPSGNRALFHCPGDVPVGWIVAGDTEPLHKRTQTADIEKPKGRKV